MLVYRATDGDPREGCDPRYPLFSDPFVEWSPREFRVCLAGLVSDLARIDSETSQTRMLGRQLAPVLA